MTDQATKLRSLVEAAKPMVDFVGVGLPLVAVSGGRAQVGATTVALNLAAVLVDRGLRVLLVDGAQHRGEAIELDGVRPEVKHSLDDLLAGRCDVGDAIVSGPAGIQMLLPRGRVSSRLECASRRDAATCDYSRHAQQRLLAELQSLDAEFDLIVVDVGRGMSPWARRFWQDARLIVLVTAPDDLALMDAYAAMKQGTADAPRLPVRLLVNRAESETEAGDVQRRIDGSCRRFLAQSLPALPALPVSYSDFDSVERASPRVWEMPNSPFGHAALWLGRAVSDLLGMEDARYEVATTASHGVFDPAF